MMRSLALASLLALAGLALAACGIDGAPQPPEGAVDITLPAE